MSVSLSRSASSASSPDVHSAITDRHELANAALTDQQLRGRSRTLGMRSRGIRRRFLATLPELDRRRLVNLRYGSIFAYAAKVGGANQEEVKGALRLARRLERFPKVWALFETGRVGRAVLMRVPVDFLEADEECWVRHFETLSKREIEALVAAEWARRRREDLEASKVSPGLDEGTAPDGETRVMSGSEKRIRSESDLEVRSSVPGQGSQPVLHQPGRHGRRILVELSEEEYARLLVARRERVQRTGRTVSMAEALKAGFIENYLDTRPAEEVDVEGPERTRLERRAKAAAKKATGARIPLPVTRFVRVRSRGHCERPGCGQPGEHIHHQIKARARRKGLPPRVRTLPRHDPDALAHLCQACHGLVHEGLVVDPYAPVSQWVLRAADSPPQRDAQDRAFGRIRAGVKATKQVDARDCAIERVRGRTKAANRDLETEGEAEGARAEAGKAEAA